MWKVFFIPKFYSIFIFLLLSLHFYKAKKKKREKIPLHLPAFGADGTPVLSGEVYSSPELLHPLL